MHTHAHTMIGSMLAHTYTYIHAPNLPFSEHRKATTCPTSSGSPQVCIGVLCMYVCMYVCMCICRSGSPQVCIGVLCMYVCMYVCMNVCQARPRSALHCSAYVPLYIHMHNHAFLYVCVDNIFRLLCLYLCMHAWMYVRLALECSVCMFVYVCI